MARTVVAGTDARAIAALGRQPAVCRPCRTDGIEEAGSDRRGELDVRIAQRITALHERAEHRRELQVASAARRVAAVNVWPVGRACPIGRVREAWVAYRYGLERVADSGAAAAGRPSPAIARRAGYAIELYERFSAESPPGWPRSGPAALLALASQRRAASFAGDVARLLILAKQMRAAALERDATRLAHAAARAQRRAARSDGRVHFRRRDRQRWQLPEQLRHQVRDELLRAGADPAAWPNAALALGALPHDVAVSVCGAALTTEDSCEALDGIGGRAARYRTELARGRYRLPPTSSHTTPTTET